MGNDSQTDGLAPLTVRLHVSDIGEAKEWSMSGSDDVVFSGWDEQTTPVYWEIDSLPLALNLVPDVMEAIARARLRGEDVEVTVKAVPVHIKEDQVPA